MHTKTTEAQLRTIQGRTFKQCFTIVPYEIPGFMSIDALLRVDRYVMQTSQLARVTIVSTMWFTLPTSFAQCHVVQLGNDTLATVLERLV